MPSVTEQLRMLVKNDELLPWRYVPFSHGLTKRHLGPEPTVTTLNLEVPWEVKYHMILWTICTTHLSLLYKGLQCFYSIKNKEVTACHFSSADHQVLKISYWDQFVVEHILFVSSAWYYGVCYPTTTCMLIQSYCPMLGVFVLSTESDNCIAW